MNKTTIIKVIILLFCPLLLFADSPLFQQAKKVLKKQVIYRANQALLQQPLTITAAYSQRSAGGIHDFFSEGDYWWPNPNDPNGPYIQRDGLSNPDNFSEHRKLMIRFSQTIGYLASAYLISGDEKYAKHALAHLNAWFIDTSTLMNPSLLYSQAIKGISTGRSIGIIDMIQLMEVAQGILVLQHSSSINKADLEKIKNWFTTYLQWVTTHPYGIAERDAKNNHGTCWVMQVAVFANLVDDKNLLADCNKRFKDILLPNQMAENGSFPLELKRSKPFGYSLFNLDAMTTICHVLSNKQEDLWDFTLEDGRTLRNAVDFMFPFVENKENWTYPPDVMYWNNWPVAHPFLLFGYKKYRQKNWFNIWKNLEHFPETEEVIRNLPIRNPLIWIAE